MTALTRYISLTLILAASVFGADSTVVKPAEKNVEAEQLFSLLAKTSPLVLGNGWNDGAEPRERWEKMVKNHGLKSFRSDSWNIVDHTGELRVMAFFLDNKTSFFLYFFPADQKPIPAPLLTTLLGKAESSSMDEANTIELAFPSTNREVSGTAFVAREASYMTIRLQSGILMRQGKIVEVSASNRSP